MPKSLSFADYVADWRRLLVALEANPDAIPFHADQRIDLEAVLEQLAEGAARQDALRAASRINAAQNRALLEQGADLALQLRSALRAQLGPRNPKLGEFRIRVLGRPRRRRAEPDAESVPEPIKAHVVVPPSRS